MGIDRKKVRSAAQKQERKGNWTKAITKYEQLVDDDGSDVRSRLKLADLYTRIDDEEAALESYKAVGNHHARNEFYEKAVAVYKQAIRLEPDDGDLHRRVGEAYHRIDRLKDAAQAYRKAQQVYRRHGERQKQLDVLEESVRLEPEDVGLHIQLAETYAKEGRRDDALQTFRTAAEMLDEEGRLDDYVQVAERILYFEPDDTRVRKKAIGIYLDRNDNKRALKHLQVCFNQDANDEDTLRKLAETFLRLERDEKAVLVFQQLAQVYQQQDRTDSARQVWERILGIDPSNQKAKKAVEALGGTRRQPRTPEQQQPDRADRPQESGEISTISNDDEPSPDTLDGVEFLDEEDEEPATGPQTPEPSGAEGSTDPTTTAGDGRQVDEADEEFDRVDLEDFEGVKPGGDDTADEPVDISDSIEPVEPEPVERETETNEEIAEMLSEADTFIKYGLYDNAREVIQNILSLDPENLPAFEKRRKVYADLEEPRAEASTLVDMARLCEAQPNRARRYLEEALELGVIDGEVRDAARELGLDLAEPAPEPEPAAEPEPVEEVEEVDPVEAGAEASDDVMELEPDEVQIIDDEEDEQDDQTRMEVTGGGEFPDFEDAIVEDSEIVEGGAFDDAELEAVDGEDLAGDTQPEDVDPQGPASADGPAEADPDRMAQTEFEEPADGFAFTEEEVDSALNGLFDSFADDEEQPVNVGSDDDEGELAQVDFYIQQELYDEAIEALEEFEEENPGHEGIDKRYYQIKTVRQGGQVEENPFGAASLSKEFEPIEPEGTDQSEDEAEDHGGEDGVEVGADLDNQNLELGNSYREMGLYDEAIEEFRQAVADPEAADQAKFYIALCKAEQGETDEAADDLHRLLDRGDLPDDVRTAAEQKLDEIDAPPA